MIGKLVVAAFAVALSSPVNTTLPAFTQSGISPSVHPEIVRVDCLVGRGSAFRVGPRTLLSVDHVTGLPLCGIGGKLYTVKHKSGDFSIITVEARAPKWLRIDCDGFIPGREYVALGYARGLDTITEVDLVATDRHTGEFTILEGVFTVIPGQSGGPVKDKLTGAVVGVVNTYNAGTGESGSLALRDTILCQA